MKKKMKIASVVTGALVIVMGATAVFSEPGSNKDPLVSKSYVDNKIDEAILYIDKRVSDISAEIKNQKPNVVESNASELEVVELTRGQSIIGENGTEIILRAGKAVAIGSELGGVSDVTEGIDIDTNTEIKKNHHLIIPRSDGRGVYSKSNTVFMVRGNYRVE